MRPYDTFSQVYAALRRKNRGQYALLAGCCFFSVLLITAYACMMRSPTILSVLPEGGDSRKQVMMVFVLAVIGCARVHHLRRRAVLPAEVPGDRRVPGPGCHPPPAAAGSWRKELALISLGSCAAGAACWARPLAWGVWQLFRLFLVDSQEMALSFDPQAYLLSLAFAALCGGHAVLPAAAASSAAPTSSTSSRSPTSPSPSAR